MFILVCLALPGAMLVPVALVSPSPVSSPCIPQGMGGAAGIGDSTVPGYLLDERVSDRST
jgi:hypothetical protein